MPRVKLTDEQKKKIIADYVINQNYSETGRMNGVSKQTVMRIIEANKGTDLEQKVLQKKEENTKNILEYMDSIAEDQKEIINLSLKALKNKLKKNDAFTSVKDIATVYGVIYDKAIKSQELKIKQSEMKYKQNASQEVLDKLDDLLEAQKDAYMD